jgi:hypothetical protein
MTECALTPPSLLSPSSYSPLTLLLSPPPLLLSSSLLLSSLLLLQGMGCRVLCQDAYENTELKALPNVEYVELSQLLAQSDVISMHAPLNLSTDHLINDDTIALMKTGVSLFVILHVHIYVYICTILHG